MPLWYGNTSLHSVGRVLDGRATSEADVSEFLQFASYLAFSDALHVNAFEHTAIGVRTREVCEALGELGVAEDSLLVREASRDGFLLACDQAAILCERELRSTFERSSAHGPIVPEMPRQEWDLQQRISEAVLDEPGEDWVVSLEQRGAHSTTLASLFMIVRNTDLRAAVREVIDDTPTWCNADAARLDTYCRLFLNDMLAQQHGAIYAPSVDRARSIGRQKAIVIDLVHRQLDKAIAAASFETTTLPGLTRVLLERGRGEPHGIIEEAFQIRASASELRQWLAMLAAKLYADPVGEYAEIHRKIEELGKDMMARFRPGASQVTVSGEISTWSLGGSITMDASGAGWPLGGRRGRAVVLSELVAEGHLAGVSDVHYGHLLRLAQRQLANNP